MQNCLSATVSDVSSCSTCKKCSDDGQTWSIHTYINFVRTLIVQGGGPSTAQHEGFLIACSEPCGLLARGAQPLAQQEEPRAESEQTRGHQLSGQEMETQKSSSSARSGVAAGLGACTKRVTKRVPEPKSY